MIIPNREALKWLLDHGMDPNLPADRGTTRVRGHMTPMKAAAKQGTRTPGVVEAMEMLLEYGAEVQP